MTALDPFRAWEVIEPLLPHDFRELAREHKQIQTQFGNAKITSAEELLRFIFAHVLSEGPLRHTVAAMEAAGGPRLSAMRLHMKLRQAAPYLHNLLQRLVPEREAFDTAGFSGFEFVALDATDVVGPGSTCAPARVHVAMKLDDLRISAVSVSDATERDGLRRFFWNPGQVVVAKASQTTAASIERVRSQGADVLLLVDLDHLAPEPAEDGAVAFEGANGSPVDAEACARMLEHARIAEQSARIKGGALRGLSEGRLIVRDDAGHTRAEHARAAEVTGSYPVALPWDDAEAAEDGDRGPRSSREPRASRVALFTTLAEPAFSAETLFDIHGLATRVLSRTSGWKTGQHVARLSNQREDTTLSWLYAKMVLGILQRRAERDAGKEAAGTSAEVASAHARAS